MHTLSGPVGNLSGAQVATVLAAALPPGAVNWRFECTAATIELRAEPSNHTEQMSYVAAGSALLNLRIAIRALGVVGTVRLFPHPAEPALVADIRPQGSLLASAQDKALARAMSRPTNWEPLLAAAVPEALCNQLRQAAKVEQAWMATLGRSQQTKLRTLMLDLGAAFESSPMIAVIGSVHDDPPARLQAGQATQRVLLTAGMSGLSASFVGQVVDDPLARGQLRQLIGGALWPQAVLRLGYPLPEV